MFILPFSPNTFVKSSFFIVISLYAIVDSFSISPTKYFVVSNLNFIDSAVNVLFT